MSQKHIKISISFDSDQHLESMLSLVNDGFNGGRLTKTDLASWIIDYFQSHCISGCLDSIRKDHFDQLAYIQNILKEVKSAQKSGLTPPDIAALLAPITSNQRTRAKRKESQQSVDSNLEQDKIV
jgi:hypothetical protein